ncbi:glycosyltransferase family 2 protein [Shewanella algae]|uniref:glycosyltransferase family 2 protein n=1 Tax=Shewanella algae TaxID=38313 RepID=UPI0008DCF300|nr:glycosyltransferase family 2 protein [Shewanella algae]EKT4489944.1 glycosyltransferase family 2 protein [Shewanella algae]MBO2664501.1 glycosyltransferase family 2 protein [Shewanella algae]MCL1056363.1 glycosyltransferase family 2 protein [Shewanella algae]OHY52230.1 glycosyl transferase [Shewanella algae]
MALPISVFIITKNEEKHIAKTLESVKEMAEVILVDSGSTDRTIEIAKRYGAKVFEHEWMGYAKQKQYAMELCSNEWVLNLDGDEAINPQLVKAFQEIIEQDKADSVRFWRNDIFIGQALSRWSKKPNNHRLYKKSKSSFDDSRLAHESATVHGKEIFINKTFDHYGYDSISAITIKNNNYSTLKANEKFIKNKKASNLKLFLIFPLVFLKEYFLQRKIFSGRRGFILAIMDAYYAFTKEAKLFENYQRKKPSA